MSTSQVPFHTNRVEKFEKMRLDGQTKEYLLKKGDGSVIVRKIDELCRMNLYCTTQWYIPHLSWAVGKSCPFSRETRGTVEGRAGSFANNHHGIIVPVPVTPSSYCILCGTRDIV